MQKKPAKKIRENIIENLYRGYSLKDIEGNFVKHGYNRNFASSLISNYKKTNASINAVLFILLAVTFGLLINTVNPGIPTGYSTIETTPILIKDIPDLEINDKFHLDLNKYFNSHQKLRFSISTSDYVEITIKKNVATIKPKLKGKEKLFFVADDGKSAIVSNFFAVKVS